MNIKTTWRFRIETKEYQSVIDRSLLRYTKRGDNTGKSKLNREKHHLPTLGILFVEPGRKKTVNWSKKKRLLVKTHAYRSSSLTWKRPRGNRQFFHLFIGWKGPRDDKTQNTHVLNSRASLGTSGNKMADKNPPRQVAFRSFDLAVIFRRRPQSRRRIEPNVKEENDAWQYHFKWRNSREKLERKVKTGMMDVAIQCLTKIFSLRNYLQAQKKIIVHDFSVF